MEADPNRRYCAVRHDGGVSLHGNYRLVAGRRWAMSATALGDMGGGLDPSFSIQCAMATPPVGPPGAFVRWYRSTSLVYNFKK